MVDVCVHPTLSGGEIPYFLFLESFPQGWLINVVSSGSDRQARTEVGAVCRCCHVGRRRIRNEAEAGGVCGCWSCAMLSEAILDA